MAVATSYYDGVRMLKSTNRIAPCLWFDGQAEQAAEFYTSVFPNSKIGSICRYTEAGHEFHHQEPGAVMTVAFVLDGHSFTALNGGPQFKFTEAISLQVYCDTQEEVDHYWDCLSADADPNAQQCGWLKDKFGVSWQVVPRVIDQLLSSGTASQCDRVMNTLLAAKKIDIAALEAAFNEA